MKYVLVLAPVCALLLSTACRQSPQKLIQAGNRYHDKKKYTEAAILYQKAINKDKTNSEAYYRAGLNLLDMNDPVNASKVLRRAIDLQPKNSDAETKLAEIYLAAYASSPQKFKELLPEIRDLDEEILQHDPNSFDGLRLQGLLHLAENDTPKALESFAKANEIKPHSPDVVWWYAQALAASGETQQAEALVRDTLKADPKWARGYDFLFVLYTKENRPGQAEAVLREHVQKDPANLAAIQNLAGYLVATKRAPEGEEVIKRVLNDPKDFPSGHQVVGDFLFRARRFDEALQQFQAGLKEDPKHGAAYNERIVAVYEATGKHDDALRLSKSVVEKTPKDATANEIYAGLLLEKGSLSEITKSLNELRMLIQNSPTDGALHFALARAYFGTHQMDRALPETLNAIQYESKRQPPRTGVLITSRLLAARIYEDRGDHSKALEQTNAILQVESGNPNARLIQDRALLAMGQTVRGQNDLEALIKQFPHFSEINDARLQLANLYLSQKEFDKASTQFQQVWQSNPPDVRGFVGLQTIKLTQGKGAEATSALEDLVKKNPGDVNLRYQLANFQTTAGGQALRSDPDRAKQLFDEAAENYKQILKTAGNSADVSLRLGLLQRQLGETDNALASFEQASSADPHSFAPYLNQALLYQDLGKRKEAIAAYNKVLGIDPENALALNNLAYMNAETGSNLDQAMTFAERAKKKVPDNPDISDTLGYVYYQKNLNAQALEIFRQVVQEKPQNALFHFHLAMALEKQGDKQAAKDEAQKALKNATQPEDKKKISTFLNQLG